MAPPDEDPTANRASRAATLLGRTPQDAVRRWVYQPTLLGAESVELITSTVSYTHLTLPTTPYV